MFTKEDQTKMDLIKMQKNDAKSESTLNEYFQSTVFFLLWTLVLVS
jgi:hypothetical protein